MIQFMFPPQVIFPPVSGLISNNLPVPLIALLGPLNGIALGNSWHHRMISVLQKNGYTGSYYIPVRLDADESDYSVVLNSREDQNNRLAVARSTKVIYWQSALCEVNLLLYTLAMHELCRSERDVDSHVFFGEENYSMLGRSLATVSCDIPVYTSMNDISAAVINSR